ncbi:recombination protein RecR [Hydrogenophilus thermoluteolus]|uniref:recombination mediator RecR n=1 Tax=Hydrogenophilus thermoluteolus TaxID=297 RepID=UPI0024A21EE3|nr:recombination mediator RecR [Hydrogenophilus thermoluteolus]GLW60654.1 recombination protein RecR [Hydrogenophilus thermoluteolus]
MSQALNELIDALKHLPGLGPRSAQRLAHYLLNHDRAAAKRLARALGRAAEVLVHCSECNTFSETPVCARCADPARDRSVVCVVETPADLEALDAAHVFQGCYYVLMGRLSPLDGIGPKALGIEKLLTRISRPEVKEVVLATNFTAEGEATAQWLAERIAAAVPTCKITRLARGVPVGGELEYADPATIAYAWHDRRALIDQQS